MTTPRFLILPDLIVSVDRIVSIEQYDDVVFISVHVDGMGATTKSTMPEVTAALREAMKTYTVGADLATGESETKVILCDRVSGTYTDIAQQARETREAGGGA